MARQQRRGPDIKQAVREILEKYDIDPDDQDWCWDCHGTLVLTHRAYEIIAAKEMIQFAPPTIASATLRDGQYNVSVVVTGTLGERTEWSFGEASDLNYTDRSASQKMALYPFAMAEKRGKDRVVAKLVGLAAYCYSEEEAAEFKEAKPNQKGPTPESNGADVQSAPPKEQHPKLNGKPIPIVEEAPQNNLRDAGASQLDVWAKKVVAGLANARSPADVDALMTRCQAGLSQADKDNRAIAQDIRARFTARRLVLERTGGQMNV